MDERSENQAMGGSMKLRGEGSTLNGFIDKGSHVRGDLVFEDTFRIDGRFEGKIRSGSELILGDTAEVTAEIDVGRLSVNGSLKGSVRASERVELLARARVFADITTPTLRVEEGAVFHGGCQMGEEEASNLVELPFPRPGNT
jgi:cytoskeletal protein CcmA (bactofilin family)